MNDKEKADGLRELLEEADVLLEKVRKFLERVEVKNSGWDTRRLELLEEIEFLDKLQSSEFGLRYITPDDYSD